MVKFGKGIEGMSSDGVSDKTNADRVLIRTNTLANKHTQSWFRAVAETFLKGPAYIYLRRNVGDLDRLSNFVRTFYADVSSLHRRSSWAIYQEDNGSIPGCILRHAAWDREMDVRLQSWKVEDIPRISSTTYYVTEPKCADVLHWCGVLDQALATGPKLEPRPGTDKPTWNHLSVFRAFDYGYKDIGWNLSVRNISCEEAIAKLTATIEESLRRQEARSLNKLAQMEMVYEEASHEIIETLIRACLERGDGR